MERRIRPLTMRFSSFTLFVAEQATVRLCGRLYQHPRAGHWALDFTVRDLAPPRKEHGSGMTHPGRSRGGVQIGERGAATAAPAGLPSSSGGRVCRVRDERFFLRTENRRAARPGFFDIRNGIGGPKRFFDVPRFSNHHVLKPYY
jgi:hypothetical protein